MKTIKPYLGLIFAWKHSFLAVVYIHIHSSDYLNSLYNTFLLTCNDLTTTKPFIASFIYSPVLIRFLIEIAGIFIAI